MSAETILVADDDRAIRTVVQQALGREGFNVRVTGAGSTLWQWVEAGDGDLVITDVVMPDANGLDLLPRILKQRPELRVIVMSARNTVLTALEAAERGAFDYLPKPFDIRELVKTVRSALDARNVAKTTPEDADGQEKLPLIGRSPAMQEIYRVMARLMATDLTVLITGDSGTGKELVARALHEFGKRRTGPFVAVNMAAIPRELIEAELFGHERGAFTGAVQRGEGRFEQAEGGTLFLDEIGDMPIDAQTRLLRVLQQGEFMRVGGRQAIRSNVRIVAATHRDLRLLVRQGLFREDLYYRLNVVPLRLPTLAERREDVPELVNHFLARAAAEGLPFKHIDASAMALIQNHPWPGNVRELENFVKRISVLYAQEVIDRPVIEMELAEPAAADDESLDPAAESLGEAAERHIARYFRAHDGALPASGLFDRVMREVERPLLALTLEATNGNQLQAARVLGVNRNTLRKKIRELDIHVARGPK